MPPVTTHARLFHNNALKNSPPQGKSSDHPPSPRRRRPRHNSKTYPKHSPKNPRRKPAECPKKHSDSPLITYDRDTLLSLRHCPLSNQAPELPPIPGVTVPRIKEKKEMPESLKIKLLKKGIDIWEVKPSCDQQIAEQTDAMNNLSITKQHQYKCDVTIWQSCMNHLL